ncbi:MAG TPA: isoaspartyl peptidase/L-asparaginase [Oceanospirillales bacterium]|nr:isoaspartyl peptidase/L-asparaginase [Oceanospirillales bacterium]
MKAIIFIMGLVMTISSTAKDQQLAIVIHGGAGTILKQNLSDDKERAIRAKLKEAIEAGYNILQNKGSSTEAVMAAINVLENSPLFNAGRGAVYTKDGKHELDASIMRGSDLQAGAVAGVTRVKNPINAANAVMLHSPHVMLSGQGADHFAKKQKLTRVENKYFDSAYRLQQWQHINAKKEISLSEDLLQTDHKYSTVGAVAIDHTGTITAGTSTGGMTNKAYGRIGDSPIIGAGTYADNRSCGISATGHGEYFIRYAVAHDICARVLYKNIPLQQSAQEVINGELKKAGGDGGIIGLDIYGNPVMVFNTTGMYRGYKTENSDTQVFIYK